MRRLYIFAIGGTGARVMRSLTMLMSAGELADYEVVPIVMDYDIANGNRNQTLDLIYKYSRIAGSDSHRQEGFFCSRVSAINDVNNACAKSSFAMDLQMPHDCKKFSDIIDYPTLRWNNPLRLLVDSLFANNNYQDELNHDLLVGFKGNAKIARIGFAATKIQETPEFLSFRQTFAPDRDKVILTGSTFGGTGCVGVLEVLRQLKHYFPMSVCNIAMVLLDPYFVPIIENIFGNVDPYAASRRISHDFWGFYNELGLSEIVGTTYKIGADNPMLIEFADGGYNQRNKAHTVELLSAMAICEYADTNQRGFFEYCFGRDNLLFGHDGIEQYDFYQMPNGRKIFELLTQYILAAMFYRYQLQNRSRFERTFLYGKMLRLHGDLDCRFVKDIEMMFDDLLSWIGELSDSVNDKYRLNLYDINAPLDEIVRSCPYNPRRRLLVRHDIVRDFIDIVNKKSEFIKHGVMIESMSPEETLLKIMSDSIQEIFQQLNF